MTPKITTQMLNDATTELRTRIQNEFPLIVITTMPLKQHIPEIDCDPEQLVLVFDYKDNKFDVGADSLYNRIGFVMQTQTDKPELVCDYVNADTIIETLKTI